MDNYDILLRKIANTLLLHVQYVDNNGLLTGKLGIALFFYHYSGYSSKEYYTEFPDKLLDIILGEINEDMPINYNEGLSGIGWAVNYLIQNGFVEGDEDSDILSDIDCFIDATAVETDMAELDMEIPLFSKGLYFIQRGKPDLVRNSLDRLITIMENKPEEFKMSYINSVLYFLLKCQEISCERSGEIISLLSIMKTYLGKSILQGTYRKGDLPYLLQNINGIKVIDEIFPEYEPFIGFCEKNISEAPEDRLYYLYTNVPQKRHDIDSLSLYVDSFMDKTNSESFAVLSGLAGVGIDLLLNRS